MIKDLFEIIIFTIFFCLVCFLVILIIAAPFSYFNFSTPGQGTHTGYVTGVNNTGWLYKTKRAYFQTSDRSSKANSYCVTDDKVYAELQKASDQNANVLIHYHGYRVNTIKTCAGESFIIDGVKFLRKAND